MASDQQVSARAILDAELEIRRVGRYRALEELEHFEPDLAAYLMESLGHINAKLLRLAGPVKPTHRLYARIEMLCLACITALRKGHYELWRQSQDGKHVEQLDPEREPDEPKSEQ